MTSGACCIDDCKESLATSRDVFCVAHWRQLPRRYRVELVTLRNAAQRRSKTGAADYARAIAAAAWLLTVGQAASQATSGPE
jgi:hypothetical protein